MDTLTIYVIRNKEGKYLRAKGYHGYGSSWVELYYKINEVQIMNLYRKWRKIEKLL
jgi:hypothetical protein